ncbi:MAG: hypothetical protein SGJ02_11010 [bacterium]|nr:hypothetical protein [bacterium]
MTKQSLSPQQNLLLDQDELLQALGPRLDELREHREVFDLIRENLQTNFLQLNIKPNHEDCKFANEALTKEREELFAGDDKKLSEQMLEGLALFHAAYRALEERYGQNKLNIPKEIKDDLALIVISEVKSIYEDLKGKISDPEAFNERLLFGPEIRDQKPDPELSDSKVKSSKPTPELDLKKEEEKESIKEISNSELREY